MKFLSAQSLVFILASAAIGWGATDLELIRRETEDMRVSYAKEIGEVFNRAEGRPMPVVQERSLAVERELHSIVQKGIIHLLDSGGGDPADLTAGIRAIQDTPLGAPGADDYSNLPFADEFQINGSRGATISYFGGTLYAPPYLEFYVASGGQWGLKSRVGEEFGRSTFFVSKLPSPLSGQVWYLAWGHQIGDTGTRLKLRLYAFNGSEARTVWSREGLTHGEVRVSGSAVTLEYEKVYNVPGSKVTEDLFVTPNGLE